MYGNHPKMTGESGKSHLEINYLGNPPFFHFPSFPKATAIAGTVACAPCAPAPRRLQLPPPSHCGRGHEGSCAARASTVAERDGELLGRKKGQILKGFQLGNLKRGRLNLEKDFSKSKLFF